MTSSLIHATKAEVDAVEQILARAELSLVSEVLVDGYWRALAEAVVEGAAEARAADHYGHLLDMALMDSRVAADQAHDAAMRQR